MEYLPRSFRRLFGGPANCRYKRRRMPPRKPQRRQTTQTIVQQAGRNTAAGGGVCDSSGARARLRLYSGRNPPTFTLLPPIITTAPITIIGVSGFYFSTYSPYRHFGYGSYHRSPGFSSSSSSPAGLPRGTGLAEPDPASPHTSATAFKASWGGGTPRPGGFSGGTPRPGGFSGGTPRPGGFSGGTPSWTPGIVNPVSFRVECRLPGRKLAAISYRVGIRQTVNEYLGNRCDTREPSRRSFDSAGARRRGSSSALTPPGSAPVSTRALTSDPTFTPAS